MLYDSFILLLLFSYSCPVFFPIALPYLAPPLPQSISPVVCAHQSSIHVSCPSPFFPHYPPPLSPLVTVSLFFIKGILITNKLLILIKM